MKGQLCHMQSNKKVQILMSTYNGEKYLKEQLDSIFKQTYPNIEVLVRDDGSKDSTLKILKEYQKTHPKLFEIGRASCRERV